jgi:hypothetical protein
MRTKQGGTAQKRCALDDSDALLSGAFFVGEIRN